MVTLESIGESALIARLQRRLFPGRDVIVGPGDDCAVVRVGTEDWLLTSDPVIDGVHFEACTDPEAIGHKAIARALSDIAAMGGTPRWALVNLVVPHTTDVERLDAVYDGMAITAKANGIAIVGGDVAKGPLLELHLFAVGSLPCDSAILRSGATPGDGIYVTGSLGGSRLNKRHLTFTPRIREGLWIRNGHWASAMCDISDGLSTDLHHLTDAGHVGAELQFAVLPGSEAARHTDTPLAHILTDGEDFELLFTVPSVKEQAFVTAWQRDFALACTRIGRITDGSTVVGIDANGTRSTLTAAGYDHFAGGTAPA